MTVTRTDTTRPGVLTSEFWISVLSAVYLALNASGILSEVPPRYSAIALAIITALYTLSRGVAKHGSTSVQAPTFLGLGSKR
jgi:hypothetical protein